MEWDRGAAEIGTGSEMSLKIAVRGRQKHEKKADYLLEYPQCLKNKSIGAGKKKDVIEMTRGAEKKKGGGQEKRGGAELLVSGF